MADIGLVESELAALPTEQKRGIVSAFRYVLNNLSFGAVDFSKRTRATNFQAYYLTGTTSSNANEEFSIAHGLNAAPSVIFPVLALDAVNCQMVPLTVSRAADSKRVYLKSSSTGATIALLVG